MYGTFSLHFVFDYIADICQILRTIYLAWHDLFALLDFLKSSQLDLNESSAVWLTDGTYGRSVSNKTCLLLYTKVFYCVCPHMALSSRFLSQIGILTGVFAVDMLLT